MAPEKTRFLMGILLTMLGWVVLLGAGYALSVFIGDCVDSELVRWPVNVGTLLGSVRLALLLQRRVLARVDPDGRHRAQLARLGTDADDE